GIRDKLVTGVQTCALPIYRKRSIDPEMSSVRLWPERLQENWPSGLQRMLRHVCGGFERAFKSDAQRHRACRQTAGTRASCHPAESPDACLNREPAESSRGRKLRNSGFVARSNQTTAERAPEFVMKFSNVLATAGEWLRGEGPHHQVVISSRVRLARNLRSRPFPGWAKKAERTSILELVRPRVEELS